MNKRNKERIAFTVQQVFNLNIHKHNPMEYDEGFLEWCRMHSFRLRNRITNACCKLPLPVTTQQIGEVFNQQFDLFKKEYEEEIK